MHTIGIDWGTSAVRAYRFAPDGRVEDVARAPLGIQALNADHPATASRFDEVFSSLVAPWRESAHPVVIACGMVGSAHGWREVPYVDVPADPIAIGRSAAAVQSQAGLEVRILPGLVQRGSAADVMRGEETQVVGALAYLARSAAAVPSSFVGVLPGTHCKWIEIVDRVVHRFVTAMTGELFDVLSRHSILARLLRPIESTPNVGAGFHRGLLAAQAARRNEQSLAQILFSARTLPLLGDLPEAEIADYLSGMLVGDEVGAACARYPRDLSFVVIGEPAAAERYRSAIASLQPERNVEVLPDTAPEGLWRIATACGWWPSAKT